MAITKPKITNIETDPYGVPPGRIRVTRLMILIEKLEEEEEVVEWVVEEDQVEVDQILELRLLKEVFDKK